MTITNELVLVEFAGDDVATVFSYQFRILKEMDVTVTLQDASGINTVQTLTTDYTVQGVGVNNGSVTMVVAPATGEFLSIFLDPPFHQTAQYPPGGPFPSTVHEKALDELANMAKNLLYRSDRSLQRPDGDQGSLGVFDAVLRRIINLADPIDDTDAAHKSFVNAQIAASILDPSVVVSSYGATLIDDVDAAEARVTLGAGTKGAEIFQDVTSGDILTALGITAYIQTLLDDVDAAAAQATLEVPDRRDPELVNLALNGDFQIWQNGTVFNSTTPAAGGNDDGEYTADMWALLSNTDDSVDVTQTTDTLPAEARAALKVTTVIADDQHGFAQWFEHSKSKPLRSLKVSMSIDVEAAGDLTDFRAYILSWNGSADAPTKDIVGTWNGGAADPTPVANVALVANVDIVASGTNATFRLENITVPADCNNLGVFICSFDAVFTAAQVYEITKWNLVASAFSADYRVRDFDDELRACERFYQKTFNYPVVPASSAGTSGALIAQATDVGGGGNPDIAALWKFHTRMRKAPTVVTFNPDAAGSQWDEVGGSNVVTANVTAEGESGCHIDGNEAALISQYAIHASADARWT